MANMKLEVTIDFLDNSELDDIEEKFNNFLKKENAQLQALVPGKVTAVTETDREEDEDDEEDED
jgi:hypothetical protein